MKRSNIIILLVLLLIIIINYFFCYKDKESYENNKSFGFIITRHVNSDKTNHIWKTCINQIRKYYPTEKIIIIDDNSNYEFITNDNVNLENCEIIDSEYKKRGELLPYYYFYKNHWFDRAIYIHDSVFIENKINTDNIVDVKFLWHFNGNEGNIPELIQELLSKLNNNEELIELFNNSDKWKGCWGVMSVIDYDFLKKIMDKYNIENLLNYINNRDGRCSFERVFALICINEKPKLLNNPSIFGYYGDSQNNRKSGSYNYEEYTEDINNGNMKANINKLFFGR